MPSSRLQYLAAKSPVDRLSGGKFIAIEGIQGAGKTTQALRLSQALRGAGVPVENGAGFNGSPALKSLSAIIDSASALHLDAITEMFIASAAKRALVQNIILPAIAEEKWVLWEGFIGTTFPRYTHTRNVNIDDAREIDYIATANYTPDMGILLHLDTEQAARRNRGKGTIATLTRPYQHEDVERITADALLAMAQEQPQRWHIIDATLPIEQVADLIVTAVTEQFPRSFAA